ncbi:MULTISPECIES: hypothetical protein [Caballeronia]|uniref:Uncharacterized protein n=1 Tax=Caballeronia jiangsuensis TaxID=1458357 RepID=A0ABW9CI99_9BURK|nr:hypothetical protein [Caballeronia sp. GaOx3]
MDEPDERSPAKVEREIAECWRRIDDCQEQLIIVRSIGNNTFELQRELDRLQAHRTQLEQTRALLTAR